MKSVKSGVVKLKSDKWSWRRGACSNGGSLHIDGRARLFVDLTAWQCLHDTALLNR